MRVGRMPIRIRGPCMRGLVPRIEFALQTPLLMPWVRPSIAQSRTFTPVSYSTIDHLDGSLSAPHSRSVPFRLQRALFPGRPSSDDCAPRDVRTRSSSLLRAFLHCSYPDSGLRAVMTPELREFVC